MPVPIAVRKWKSGVLEMVGGPHALVCMRQRGGVPVLEFGDHVEAWRAILPASLWFIVSIAVPRCYVLAGGDPEETIAWIESCLARRTVPLSDNPLILASEEKSGKADRFRALCADQGLAVPRSAAEAVTLLIALGLLQAYRERRRRVLDLALPLPPPAADLPPECDAGTPWETARGEARHSPRGG